jgi:hypothetical protein
MKRRAFFQNVAAIAAAPVAAKLVPDVPDIRAAQSPPPIQQYVTMMSQMHPQNFTYLGPFQTISFSSGYLDDHDALMAKADAARKGGK